jgi:hypothetical protein
MLSFVSFQKVPSFLKTRPCLFKDITSEVFAVGKRYISYEIWCLFYKTNLSFLTDILLEESCLDMKNGWIMDHFSERPKKSCSATERKKNVLLNYVKSRTASVRADSIKPGRLVYRYGSNSNRELLLSGEHRHRRWKADHILSFIVRCHLVHH